MSPSLFTPGDVLFLCDALVAHALAGLGQFAQHILTGQITGAQHARPDGEIRPVPTQPVPCACNHGSCPAEMAGALSSAGRGGEGAMLSSSMAEAMAMGLSAKMTCT